MIMKMINIHEAKTHLSRYLEEVEQGGVVILCKRNRPVAEIRQIIPRSGQPRAIGLAKGSFAVPATFFDELPAETLSRFSGEEL